MSTIPSNDGYFEISYDTKTPLFSENPPTPTTCVFERTFTTHSPSINRSIKHYRVCHCHPQYLDGINSTECLLHLKTCVNYLSEKLDDAPNDYAHKLLKQEVAKDKSEIQKMEHPNSIPKSSTSPECLHSA